MKLCRRIVVLVITHLLGGVLINVAMAWACVSTFNPFMFDTLRGPPGLLDDGLFRRGSFWQRFGHCQSEREYGRIHTRSDMPSDFPSTGAGVEIHAGWPMISVAAVGHPNNQVINVEKYADWQDVRTIRRFDGGIFVDAMTRPQYPMHMVLPYNPLWPGFAINTLFYAAMLWLIFFVPFAARRWFRRLRERRGLCPACAYPVGVSDVCTECGAVVNPKVVIP